MQPALPILLVGWALGTAAHAQVSITSISIASTPEADQSYEPGEKIKIQVQMSFGSFGTSGIPPRPTLSLTIGSNTRTATAASNFLEGATPNRGGRLNFEYEVQASDKDTNGISIPANPITKGAGNLTNVNVDYAGLTDQSGHKVNAVAGVKLSTTALTVTEGSSETYSVKLRGAPSANVTVAIAKDSGGDADLSVSPASLTFTPSNWSTGQTVTVTARADTDSSYGNASFTHTASSTDTSFNNLTASLAVTSRAQTPTISRLRFFPSTSKPGGVYRVGDLMQAIVDFSQDIEIDMEDQLTLTLSIGSETRNMTVASTVGSRRINFEYVIQAGDRDGNGISIPPDPIQVPSGSRIYSADDNNVDADLTYAGLTDQTTIQVDSDVRVSRAALALWPGHTGTYTVKLAQAPSANVTVAIARNSSGDADLSVSPTSLTFTPVNWSTEQTVTVTARADTDSSYGNATFTHTASSTDTTYNNITTSVEVTTIAPPAIDSISITSDPGSDQTYAVGDTITVVVSFTKPILAQSRVNLNLSIGGSVKTLTYSGSANFSTSQGIPFSYTVKLGDSDTDGISIPANPLRVPAGSFIAAITAEGQFVQPQVNADLSYAGLADQAGHKVDGLVPSVDVSSGTLTVTEGATATYAVKLGKAPSANVTVAIARNTSGDTDLSVNPASLTFTPSNWDTEQTVTVSAAEDTDNTNGSASFTHTASSTDTGYDGLTASVVVTEDDNEGPGVLVSKEALTVRETTPGTYRVQLRAEPSANVTIAITKDSGGDADLSVSPTSLTFTSGNWSTGQTVTVTARGDTDSSYGSASFTHTASSTDTGYAGLTASVVVTAYEVVTQTGTVTEDDTTANTASGTIPGRFPVGTTDATFSAGFTYGTFTIKADRTWTYTLDNTRAATQALQAGQTATETYRLENTAQTAEFAVTITINGADDGLTLRIAPVAGNGVTIPSSDAQRGEIAEDAASGTVTLAVTLFAPSTGPVTVAYATADFSSTDTAVSSSSIDPATAGADYTAASGTLMFAAGETRKTITVSISDDVNRERDELFKVGLSSATGGATIASSGSEATILIKDDDPWPKATITASVPGLMSTGAPGATGTTPEGFLSVAEDDSGNTNITFTVTLEGTDYEATAFVMSNSITLRALGSAAINEDYTVPPSILSPRVVIAAGQTTGTLTLSVVGDENYEPDETLFLEFFSSRLATNVITNSADTAFVVEVTIANDDPVMATSASNLQARPAGSGNLAVSWDPAFGAPNGYSVRWRKASESDTALSAVNTVTATSYTITGLDNDTSYHVRLDTRNLANDDIASDTSLTTAATPTSGAAPTVTAIANQNARVGQPFEVDVDATPGTAGDSLQYQAASSAPAVATVTPTALTAHDANSQVTVTPVAAGTATITVTVSDGTEVGTETFDVTVSQPTLSIAPVAGNGVTVSSSDAQRGEIDEDATSGAVTLEVTLSESSTEVVTVAYATADFASTDTAVSSSSIDPATAGADYTAASGTLTFAAGETRKTITVSISDDVNRERDELFKVGLSSATGGAIIASSGSEATILIDDDDPAPKATITASVAGLTSTGAPGATFTAPEGFLSVDEGDSGNTDITFTVTLEGTDHETTDFTVDSIDGSATGNEDYRVVGLPGIPVAVVGIAPGQTIGTFTLPIIGDENYEPDETLFLQFTNNRAGGITNSADTRFRVEVTITNDDAVMATSASNLQARPAGSGNLAVSWDPAFGAPNGYSVRWRKASESDTALSAVNTVTATSYTITGLDNDTSYHVRLDTRNLANDDIASDTSLTTAATPTSGAAPTVTAIANQNARVGQPFEVDVDATPGTAGDSLQYQAASSAPAVATVTPTALTAHSASSTVRVTPVAAGTATITVTVSDGTEVGTETFDVTVSQVTLGYSAPPPTLTVDTPITALTATAAGFGSATVSYAVTTGTLPAGLTINAGSGAISGTPTAASTTTTTVTVTATAGTGMDTQTATADITFPAVGKATLAKPTNLALKANSNTRTGFTVTWDAVANAAGYTATATPSGGSAVTGTVSVPSSGPEAEFTGLTANTAYTVTVTATGDANYMMSESSDEFDVTTAAVPSLTYPALPTILRAGVQFATLTPASPANFAAGSTFTYAVTAGDLPSGLELNANTGAISGTPDTPKNTRTSVTVTVTGTTGTGGSIQTETATATLNFPRIFRFRLPTPTVTLAVGDTQLTANWDAVANVGTYALQWKESSVTSWTAATGVTTVDPATPGTVITGLTNGTIYDVRVRSEAAPGSTTHIDSDWSSAVQGVPTADATFSVTGPATVAEDAGTATYTVTLSAQPAASVTVDYATADGTATADADYTAASGTLTFTPTNWDTAQTVAVTISNDTVDDDDETFTFTLSNPGTGAVLSSTASSQSTTIMDDDVPAVTVSFGAATYSVREGATVSVAVSLSAMPERSLTIPLTATNGTGATSSDYSVPRSVTFASTETSKTLTFSATDDAVDEANETVTLGFGTLPPRLTAGTTSQAAVTITDDDSRGLMLSATSLAVNENASGTYTVELSSQPTTNVTVTVGGATGDISVDTSTESGDQTTLTFTPTNWSMPQPVTVKAADDDDAVNDAAVTLTHTASGGDYALLTGPSLSVTIIENDAATFSATGPSFVAEDGGTATYTVSLSARPSTNVTINYATADGTATAGSDYTAARGTLTFTPTNWDTAQTVAVTISNDTVDDDNETFTFTLSNPGTGAVLSSTASSQSTTITDDDVPALTVSFGAATYNVREGATVSVAVSLSAMPERSLTIPLTATNGTGATSSDYSVPRSVTFARTETSKTLTFSATDDAVDEEDEMVTLGFGTLPPRLTAGTTSQAAVTITDDDSRGLMLSATSLVVNENASGTYTVELSSQPTTNVAVTVGGATGDISVDTSTESGDQTTLTFTPTNWSMPQPVTVKAADDDDAVTDTAVTLTHTASGGDYASLTGPSLSVTIIENDAATFSATGPSFVAEDGGTATYTVSLSARPSTNVTINYATADGTATAGSDYTATSGTLTFTPTNWDTAQTVMVTISNDTVDDDNETFTFTLSNPGTGTVLSSTASSQSTTITDDDVSAVTVSFGAATYNVREGATVSVAVSLNAMPERSLTIPLTATNGTGATSSDYNVPRSVTFARTETSKTLTFSATDDAVDEEDEMVTLGFGTLPPRLTAGTTSQAAVTITDDDSRGLMLSATSLAVNENASGTYTVELSSQPTTNVTVTVGGATGDISVDTSTESGDQTTLTFTPTNWSTPRMVMVAAADDDDAVNDAVVTLTHTASGGDYASLTGPSLSVTITENDTRGVTLSTTTLTVNEGDTESYTVLLDSEPTGNVTVTIGGTDNTDITVDTDPATTGDQTTLTFTPTNWSTPRMVMVAAADDDDALNDAVVTLTHTASGGDYASLTGPSLSVTIIENDAATFSATGPATIAEGAGTATYTVSLSVRPSANVTINYATADGTATAGSDYTAASGTLTFTPANWETNQTVDVTITEDTVDENDETFNFTLSNPGSGAVLSASPSLSTTITDNDVPALTVSFGATIPAQTWTVDVSVDLTLPEATGGNGTISYELTPDLPPGVMLDPSTRTLSGAPTAAATATTYTWRATDSDGNTAALSFSVTVSPAPNLEATLRYPAAPTTLTVGTTITPLPATTTGLTAPITYAVRPDLPAGLTLSTTTGEISGTPTTVNPDGVTVTVTATTDDGKTATANITFPPVAAAPPLTEERRDEVNTEILPSIINQVAENQVAIITGRSEFISSGLNRGNLSMEEVVTDVADYLFSHHQEIQANGFDWRQALSGKNFSFALADTSAPQSGMDDGKPSSSGSGPLSFWGAIDYSSLQDNIETISLDGDTLSFNFGVDKEFTSDLVLGILLSIANSEFDLTGGFTGTYEVDLSTLNPYISWQASEDLSLWASVGYGRGQVDLTETSGNAPISQGGNFTRFSAGGRFQLWQSETGTALALKLDGTTAHFLEADVQRSRLATELSHDFSIESGVLNTALELGLLMSSADEPAAELVGGLHWQGDAGLSGSIRSRVLLGGGDRQEWGIGGALRYTAGGGEGLMMALEPSFGISNPQLLSELWSATRLDLAVTREAPTAQLNVKLAYGFPTSAGLLTPYTDLSFSETTNTYVTGLRYGLPTGWNLNLKGMRKTSTTDTENTILLELRSDL